MNNSHIEKENTELKAKLQIAEICIKREFSLRTYRNRVSLFLKGKKTVIKTILDYRNKNRALKEEIRNLKLQIKRESPKPKKIVVEYKRRGFHEEYQGAYEIRSLSKDRKCFVVMGPKASDQQRYYKIEKARKQISKLIESYS
jgi:hypothetical protein